MQGKNFLLQLCILALIATVNTVVSMKTPMRPNISDTFSAWFETTSLYVDGVSMSYRSLSAYVSVVANSKSLFNVTYSADSLESTLSLYDQGMEYDIEGEPSDDYYDCESYSIDDDFESMWSFQSDLEYVGTHETLNADVWNAGYSDCNLTLGVSTTNPNMPLFFIDVDFYTSTINKISVIGFSDKMPNDSDFNISPICSEYQSKKHHQKPRRHSKKGLNVFKRKFSRKSRQTAKKQSNEDSKKLLNAFNKFKLF